MDTAQPLVSVVIPCYNYGRFLGEAIESVLNQTYRAVEVIVVDDGSTDDTAAIAAHYPIRLMSQPNSGVCNAINTGVRLSNGEYVMRLDADDRLDPTYVTETLTALLEEPGAHFAYTYLSYFGARSGTFLIEEFDPDTLTARNYVHGSALMRRTSFDLVGGYDPKLAAARCEDWGLWLGFVERGLRGVLVPKPLLWYRQHPTGGRNALNWTSVSIWRRNFALTGYLQDAYPTLFATDALLKRLARLPARLKNGRTTPKLAALLVAFYGVMLCRRVLGFNERPAEPWRYGVR